MQREREGGSENMNREVKRRENKKGLGPEENEKKIMIAQNERG